LSQCVSFRSEWIRGDERDADTWWEGASLIVLKRDWLSGREVIS
jgi:hypothetical protein